MNALDIIRNMVHERTNATLSALEALLHLALSVYGLARCRILGLSVLRTFNNSSTIAN